MNGIKQKPDLIAIDGGSTDSGPYYLGLEKANTFNAIKKIGAFNESTCQSKSSINNRNSLAHVELKVLLNGC